MTEEQATEMIRLLSEIHERLNEMQNYPAYGMYVRQVN